MIRALGGGSNFGYQNFKITDIANSNNISVSNMAISKPQYQITECQNKDMAITSRANIKFIRFSKMAITGIRINPFQGHRAR